jgi:hypothetical protein
LIIVNPSTRQFNIPGSDLTFGVEADAGSERKYFQCPRYVGNKLDIASSFVRINYRNANGEIDSYLVEDLTVDGDNVLFSWELYPKVTAYKGQIKFVMCVTGPDTKVAWHTTLGTGMVLEGLEPDYAVIQAGTADVVAQLIALTERQSVAVENKGAEWVRNVQSEGTDQIVAVQTAGAESKAAAVAEIEAKGVNTLNSIPADYTALSEAVDGLVRGRAGAIVCEVEGTAIAVKDASDMAVQGLRIFGRSTQDGVPTPDAPVEIVSVDSPVVTICGKNCLPTGFNTVNSGITFTVNVDGSITMNGTATDTAIFYFRKYEKGPVTYQFPTGDYVFSGIPGASTETYYMTVFDDSDYDYKRTNVFDVDVPFTLTSGYLRKMRLCVYKGFTVNNVTVYPMMRPASMTNPIYEPYTPQDISLTHPLRGIPVTTGGNYTDSDGQQWICDEVDLERGVYVQRCYISDVTFDYQADLDRYTAVLKYSADTKVGVGNGIPILCNKHEFHDLAGSGSPKFNGIRIAIASPTRAIAYHNGMVITSATVMYPMAVPIETPLSETEIAAYRSLHSNKPYTTIINDSGAHMKVEYAADTKLYIDNKLAALVGNT